jgi:hypothetical protein
MLLFLVFSSFFQQPPNLIRIVEATRQEWVGGIEESGKGVNYEIRLIVNKGSAKLKFVSIIVEQQGCIYKISNRTSPEKGERYHKGDTLLISAMLKNPPNRPLQKEKPYPVIGYTYKKKIYYFSIRQGIPANKENHP